MNFPIFMILLISYVKLAKSDDENFYVNVKTALSGLFIGKINDSDKKFEAPYYIIPSQPLDMNELKSVLNINLDNGKIYLATNGNNVKLNCYKFTLLSILKGTSKQIFVYFMQQQQQQQDTENSSISTTNTDLNLLTSNGNKKTVVFDQLKILKKYHFLLTETDNLKSNTIIGNIDLATINSTIDCRFFCNFKQITNYIDLDSKTNNLILFNSNLKINFIIIEIYNNDDYDTVLVVYLKIVSSSIDWIYCSTVILNNNISTTITAFINDKNTYFSFINKTNLSQNSYIQLLENIENDNFLEIQVSNNNKYQLQMNLNSSVNQIFQTSNFVFIYCQTTTLCSYSFYSLTVKFEDLVKSSNTFSINNCSINAVTVEIYLDRIYVNNKEPVYNLNKSFFFDYKYANLSNKIDDFDKYFLFQNGIISQYSYLFGTPKYYQLFIDIFNVTYDELNNKANAYFYSCRLILNLKILTKPEKIDFYKKFYNLNISSSNVLNLNTNEIVLMNFQSVINSKIIYYVFNMVNVTYSEDFFEMNSLTGDLILYNIQNIANRRMNNYYFKITCQFSQNQTEVISTLLEINIIEDTKQCLPTIKNQDLTLNLNLFVNSDMSIQFPKHDLITQILVNECDPRTFNSRRFGFKLTTNNTMFYNLFNFDNSSGILRTNINESYSNLAELGNQFTFDIQVFDLSDNSLKTNKLFFLKLNVIDKNFNQTNNSSLSDLYFLKRIFIAEVKENIDNGSSIQYLNASLINFSNSTNLQKYTMILIDPTLTFILVNNSVQSLPNIITIKPIDRESINNYTIFLYIVDVETNQKFYDSCVLLVNILDINDNAPILNLVNNRNFIEISLYENLNEVYQKSLKAIDYDIGENARLTYKINNFTAYNDNISSLYASVNGTFALDPQTGLFLVQEPLNYEGYNRYEFNIEIADNGTPNLQIFIKLILNVIDVNDNAPKFNDTNSLNYFKLDLISNFTYQLSAPTDEIYLVEFSQYTIDMDSNLNMNNKFNFSLLNYEILIQQTIFNNVNIYLIFRIDTLNGQLYCRMWPTLKSNSIQLDSNFTSSYNVTNNYSLQVLATDLGQPKPLNSTKSIQLTITLSLNNNTVYQLFKNNLQLLIFNSTPLLYQNTFITNLEEGLPVQTFTLRFQTYSTISMKWLVWFKIISGNYDNSFQIENGISNDTGIQIVALITNRILDREIRSGYRIKIAVFYQTNTTNLYDKILLTDYAYLFINVIDVNDNAPNFLISSLNFTLNEDYPINKQITQIIAYDADAFNIIQYSLIDYNTESQQNLISIDEFTGVITANLTIDFEQINILKYKISAFDGIFRTYLYFQISVNDLNDNLPLVQNKQLESRLIFQGQNTTTIDLYSFDFDATEANSKIFYEVFNVNNLSSSILITNYSLLDLNRLRTSSNLSVFIVRLNNFYPVLNTFLQPNNVLAYSIIFLMSNGGQQQNNNKPIAMFEFNKYVFYFNQLNQIGNQLASIKIIWSLDSSSSYFNLEFKVNTNKSLPFKLVYNGNQSTIDIISTKYLTETTFNFEIETMNNKTNVSIIVYNVNSLSIKNTEKFNLNITNSSSLTFLKTFQIINANIDSDDYTLTLLNNGIFSLSNSTLFLNKSNFELLLSKYRPDLINLIEYCLSNGDSIQLSEELVIRITASFDKSIQNMNSIIVKLFVACDYLISLPQPKFINTNRSTNFALNSYNIQISENFSKNCSVTDFHYYPEYYLRKRGFNTKFYIQNTFFFMIDLTNGTLKPNVTAFENMTSRQYNFQVFGAIQSNDTIIESISANVNVKLINIDQYKPNITIQTPIVFIYANISSNSTISRFNATDADYGACGRTLFYFYQPSNFTSNYFSLNKYTGGLVLNSKINKLTLNNEDDDDIIQNSLLLSNSLLIEIYIQVSSGLPNSLYSIAKLQLFIDYNCFGCNYFINSTQTALETTKSILTVNNAQSSTSFLNSVWPIVLICIFGFIAVFLAGLLILLKVRKSCKKKSVKRITKPNTSKQTSESSLFYNSSNASTCSHVSDKSTLSFSKKTLEAIADDHINNQSNQQLIDQTHDTLSTRSTIFNSNSFSENKKNCNNSDLLKKITAPISSTIGTSDDKYLHPIQTNERNKSHFQEYLNRLGIKQAEVIGEDEDKMQKPKSPSILTTSISHITDLPRSMQQHYYFNYQSSNDNFDDIDNVMVDLKGIVSDSSVVNADIHSIQDYVKKNRSKVEKQQDHIFNNSNNNPVLTNSNTFVTSGSDACSYNNSTIGSNFNDDELSFQKWDTLLDWTPQYAPLSNIFDDLTRLDSESQFEMQKLKYKINQDSIKLNYEQEIFDEDGSSIEIDDVYSVSKKLFMPISSDNLKNPQFKNRNDNDYQDCFNEENDSEI